MPSPQSDIIGFMYEKENEVIAVASRLLAARVLSEGASVVEHDAAIIWAVRGAVTLAGAVRDELKAFDLFLKADEHGLYHDSIENN